MQSSYFDATLNSFLSRQNLSGFTHGRADTFNPTEVGDARSSSSVLRRTQVAGAILAVQLATGSQDVGALTLSERGR